MSAETTKIRREVLSAIDTYVVPFGFARLSSRYMRHTGQLTQLIQVTSVRRPEPDTATFELSMGVFLDDVFSLFYPLLPIPQSNAINAHICVLWTPLPIQPRNDNSEISDNWSVGASWSHLHVEQVINEIIFLISSDAMPLFEQWVSIDQIITFIENHKTDNSSSIWPLYTDCKRLATLACLYATSGTTELARLTIASAINETKIEGTRDDLRDIANAIESAVE